MSPTEACASIIAGENTHVMYVAKGLADAERQQGAGAFAVYKDYRVERAGYILVNKFGDPVPIFSLAYSVFPGMILTQKRDVGPLFIYRFAPEEEMVPA